MKSEIIYEVTEEEEKKMEDQNEDDDDNEEEKEGEEEEEGGNKYQKCLNGCLGLSFFVFVFYFFFFYFFLEATLHLSNWVCPLVLPSISWCICQPVHQSVSLSVGWLVHCQKQGESLSLSQ